MLVVGGSRVRLREDEAYDAPGDSLATQLERLHGRSFGWALACCRGEPDEAAEVMQAAYLKVLEGRAVFGRRSRFSTWFFGVIRMTASEIRHKRIRRRILLFENRVLLSSREPWRHEDSIASRRLHGALKKLPKRQREVLHLVFYSELSIREASEVMRIGIGTARVHYERGKKRLRDQLREESK